MRHLCLLCVALCSTYLHAQLQFDASFETTVGIRNDFSTITALDTFPGNGFLAAGQVTNPDNLDLDVVVYLLESEQDTLTDSVRVQLPDHQFVRGVRAGADSTIWVLAESIPIDQASYPDLQFLRFGADLEFIEAFSLPTPGVAERVIDFVVLPDGTLVVSYDDNLAATPQLEIMAIEPATLTTSWSVSLPAFQLTEGGGRIEPGLNAQVATTYEATPGQWVAKAFTGSTGEEVFSIAVDQETSCEGNLVELPGLSRLVYIPARGTYFTVNSCFRFFEISASGEIQEYYYRMSGFLNDKYPVGEFFFSEDRFIALTASSEYSYFFEDFFSLDESRSSQLSNFQKVRTPVREGKILVTDGGLGRADGSDLVRVNLNSGFTDNNRITIGAGSEQTDVLVSQMVVNEERVTLSVDEERSFDDWYPSIHVTDTAGNLIANRFTEREDFFFGQLYPKEDGGYITSQLNGSGPRERLQFLQLDEALRTTDSVTIETRIIRYASRNQTVRLPDGDYAVVYFLSQFGADDRGLHLTRLSPEGLIRFDTLISADFIDFRPTRITFDQEGNLYFANNYNPDRIQTLLIKTDGAGNKLYSALLNEPEVTDRLRLAKLDYRATDNSLLISGRSTSIIGVNNRDQLSILNVDAATGELNWKQSRQYDFNLVSAIAAFHPESDSITVITSESNRIINFRGYDNRVTYHTFDADGTPLAERVVLNNYLSPIVLNSLSFDEQGQTVIAGTYMDFTDFHHKVFWTRISGDIPVAVRPDPTLPEPTALQLAPNPANGFTTLSWESLQAETASISVISANGQHVLSRELRSLPGRNQLTLDLSSLPTGAYYLRVVTNTGYGVRSLIIGTR
ncbi:T9SS type A sorting domain-containing protein [Neolewinella persica]|uniref:T9SS type A sorting domain-containing protein n=1 Tax=Neolewinella persica TaxID=70998 RepID=UPI00037E02E6|nr:T9SS type A sorting domain-containing protein [Neolewinella persica]